jgi:poly(A) polymerase
MGSTTTAAPAKIQQYGLTPPISVDPPSTEDIQTAKALTDLLHSLSLYEPEEEGAAREATLGALNAIIQQWVREETRRLHTLSAHDNNQSISTNGDEDEDDGQFMNVNAELFTFGSFRLGVHGPGTDMDALCVGPKHIDRASFFSGLYRLLDSNARVTELSAVPDAYVPIVKFKMDNFDIDLIYAQVQLPTINSNFNMFDNTNLLSIDIKSVLSLNGARVTDMILTLVPNIENFRTTLIFIKYWAKSELHIYIYIYMIILLHNFYFILIKS